MNRFPVSLLLAGLLALSLASCGKPKEIDYKKLGYSDSLLIDPDTKQPFTGLARDFHKDGRPKAEYPCRKGKFHGTVREWHPNGQPLAETEFSDGERMGRNLEWTADGRPYIERVYDHDRIVSEKKF